MYEPPPPPEPKHVAPRNALWLGARASYWMPFGSLWGRCTVYDAAGCLVIETVPMRDFVGAGVALEGDVGARIARAYNLYVAWEHAELGGGSAEFELTDSAGAVTTMPSSRRAATNLYGLGVRFSSNPDRVGLLVDMLVGLRTLEVAWDPAELAPDAPRRLVLGEAPFEFRFAAGADIRLGPMFSVSPLATIGAGTFRSVEWEYADGSRTDALATTDELMDHGWFTLGAGGHFDLGGSP